MGRTHGGLHVLQWQSKAAAAPATQAVHTEHTHSGRARALLKAIMVLVIYILGGGCRGGAYETGYGDGREGWCWPVEDVGLREGGGEVMVRRRRSHTILRVFFTWLTD